jgi:hypothetical protein
MEIQFYIYPTIYFKTERKEKKLKREKKNCKVLYLQIKSGINRPSLALPVGCLKYVSPYGKIFSLGMLVLR